MLENGMETCNCRKVKCVWHGNCVQCIEYHRDKKRSPYYQREKRKRIFL